MQTVKQSRRFAAFETRMRSVSFANRFAIIGQDKRKDYFKGAPSKYRSAFSKLKLHGYFASKVRIGNRGFRPA